MGKIQIMHNKNFIAIIITLSLTFFSFSALHAGVYKWLDENGQVHYGEQPGNTGAEKFTIRKNETTKPRTIKKDSKENTEQQTEKAAEADFTVRPGNSEEKESCYLYWRVDRPR